MHALNEVLTQQQIATAGIANDPIHVAGIIADTTATDPAMTDAWNWLIDPLGIGADYFPTQTQLAIISTPVKKKSNYLLYSGIVLGVLFLLKK